MMRPNPHRLSCARRTAGAAVCCALITALVASAAQADVVVLRDGRRFEGRIVGEFPEGVVIDAMVAGIETRLPIWRNALARVDREPLPEGFFERAAAEAREPALDPNATYYVHIPIRGVIGLDVVPRGVGAALRYAVRRDVREVVFVIDSGGGSLGATQQIVEAIEEQGSDVYCRAVVRQARGEAAAIAFACRSIHVTPEGALGGGPAIDAPASVPPDAGWSAPPSQRAAYLASRAVLGGVPTYVAEPMFSPDAAGAAWRDADGGVVTGPVVPEDVPRGRVLFVDGPDEHLVLGPRTLTSLRFANALEREHLQAADGDAAQALGRALGIDKWQPVSRYGRAAIARTAAQAQREREVVQVRMHRLAAEHEADADRIARHWDAVQRYWNLYQQFDPYAVGYNTHDHYVGRGSVVFGGWIETRVTTLTPDSRREWRYRTYAAIDALLRMRSHLRRGIRIRSEQLDNIYAEELSGTRQEEQPLSPPELELGEEVVSPEALYRDSALLIERLWRERNRIEP